MVRSMAVIAGKDLLQRSRDRSAYIMGIVGPLVLVFILNSTLGAVGESSAFPLGFVDDDGGEVAAGFGQLLAELEDDQVIDLVSADNRADLEAMIDNGDVGAGFVLGPGFSEAIQTDGQGQIVVVGDPGATVTVDVAEAIAQTFVNELNYVSVAVGTLSSATGSSASGSSATGAGADDASTTGTDGDQLAATAMALSPPIELAQVEAAGRGYDAASYFALSLSVFFVFFTVQFGVLSMIEEREAGTLARLLVSPIHPAALLLGKLLSSFVIGVLTMAVLAVSTTLIVGAEWGDPIAAAALIMVGVLAAMALALLVSTVARTAEQAAAYASIAALVLGLLGGTFFPLSAAPGVLNTISMISPHRWLLDGFRDVSYGGGLADLGPNFAVLVAFIVVAGGVGLVLAGRRMVQL